MGRNPAHGWRSELLGMTAAGSITIRHVMSKTPKNQWYVVEAAKGMRFFCWKKSVLVECSLNSVRASLEKKTPLERDQEGGCFLRLTT
ncbi:DUF7338 family protein [Rhizobium leguminosarum]|uniref:DUF7338 family protein n=1 Tax=Rhizobium TaxID=379 RepID=UPI003D79E66F